MTEGLVSSRPGTATGETISKEVERTRIQDELKWNPQSRVTADSGETGGGKDNTSETVWCVMLGGLCQQGLCRRCGELRHLCEVRC